MNETLKFDMTKPWNVGVAGTQVLPLINLDAETIRVESGPGTGKTFGLSRRVVRIMHPDGLGIPGKDVLVVAFNRVIAKQLQTEIATALIETETPHTDDPIIRTVHALCLQAIGVEMRLLLPHEREAMLYDVLHEYPHMKEKYGTHKKTDQALRDHEARNSDHMELWQAVDRWLVRHHARLISDLPGMLLDHIKGGDFADRRYQHVIVDEFQDLTSGEQQLFLMLRASGGQFAALGDPRQSIYRFRGNDPGGLRKLESFLGASTARVTDLTMRECRRCPAQVVEASNQLMSLSPADRMIPSGTSEARIYNIYWKTPQSETTGMAKKIVENIRLHPDESHLVMVTRRQFGYMLRARIEKVDSTIAVDLSFSESLLEAWSVREAFLFFCLLVDPDSPTWRAWLGYRNCPDAESPYAPARNASAYLRLLKESGDKIEAEVVERLASEARDKERGSGGLNLWDRAKRFIDLRSKLKWTGGVAAELLEEVFSPDSWIVDAAEDETAKLDMALLRRQGLELIEDLTHDGKARSSSEMLLHVARRLRYQIATREPIASTNGPAPLQVATLWGAKGVTAHHVYILGLCEEAIPGTRREEYPGTDIEYVDEQRRLFYVSITRPKRTLVLSRAVKIQPGDAKQLNLGIKTIHGHWADLRMCPFLRDIMPFLPKAQPGEGWTGV